MKTTLLLAGLLLAPSAPTFAAQVAGPPVEAPAVAVRPELEARLDAGIEDYEALYQQACADTGEVQPLLDELAALDADLAQPEARRRAARWARAMLLRRDGQLLEALRAVEPFAAEEGNTAARLDQAFLLDAVGREEQALEAYQGLLELGLDEETETRVRLRLALLQMGRGDEQKDALAAFALEEGRGSELRNRAAIVLALLDRPADAIALFEVDATDDKRFRQELRVAEWALRAEDAAKAQEFAWDAVRSAKLHRDRFYALTLLVEAHRLDDSLDALVDKLAATPDLDEDTRRVWIELLRERGRFDEAIELFKAAAEGTFSVEQRRELLEMYREKGDEEVMNDVYHELVAAEPRQLEWREGLSRSLLERGDRAGAVALWREFLGDPRCANLRLEGAKSLMGLGLDELAIEAAEACIADDDGTFAALIFLFELHKSRGRLDLAEAALERMEALAPPGAAERYQLADAWEQLGRLDRAVTVLESVRAARGPDESGEDLEMRLAWLYSEIGEEETALQRWHEIWLRLKSVSRRRYAEDRMMTVAARLGSLADIAIELEQKLVAGTADERDSGLLVRLYTKVGDPVSAAEVIDEFMKQSGGSELDTLQEKGRVYLACNDYYNYEKVVRRLIELDPEGEPDYLQQLAMSQLERGKPDEARVVLARMKELEGDSESAEFEAGVLALGGLREDAIKAYRKGIAQNPGRIESYLLMAKLMKELGETDRAVGMFQTLAETADKDDLFTIAIDGLLNVEAPAPVMQWARRITLERLAVRHDKMYLYQLLSDLAEQVEQREGMLTALENSLAISGERRPAVLRELMDLSKGGGTSFTGRGWSGDEQKHLAYGRRLIGLAEVVPPQVYLDLGEAFLKAGDPANAQKTFRLASDLPDYVTFQRQAAGLFEQSGYRAEALDLYKRVLIAQSNDVGLMVKVGELEEQDGRDRVALQLYREALELLFSRQPLSRTKSEKEQKQGSFFAWYGSRNLDDYDKYYGRLLKNLLVVQDEGPGLEELLATQREAVLEDLTALSGGEASEAEGRDDLDKHPRVRARAGFLRRLAFAYGRPALADELDLALLAAFPKDDGLLEALCQGRMSWGLYGSVRKLLDEAARPAAERDRLRFLVGQGLDERSARRLPIDQASTLFLPLLMQGKNEEAGVILRRTDFASIEQDQLDAIEPLFSASLYLGDPDLTLLVGREWVRLHVKHRSGSYAVEPVLQKCKQALDAEAYRNLCLSFTDQVLEKPAETSDFLTLLPTLQKDFEEPLITEEQVMELLDEYAEGGWGFGLGPVVLLLPEENRGGAMRAIWSKINESSRTYFLFDLVGDATEELGPAVCEFVADAFRQVLQEDDDVSSYYARRLSETRYNQALTLEMLDAMIAHDGENWTARSSRALRLLAMGRDAEALEEAQRVYAGLWEDDGEDWERRNALQLVLDKLLPEHLDVFAAELDRVEAERGPSVTLYQKRLDLLRRADADDAAGEALTRAVELFPDEIQFLDELRAVRASEGRRGEALALLERVVAKDEKRKPELLGFWAAAQNPLRQLAVKEELMAAEKAEETPETQGEVVDGILLQPGMVLITASGAVVTGGSGKRAAEDRPTIGRVKDAVDARDWAAARTQFRRLWRQFPKGEGRSNSSFIVFSGSRFGGRPLAWPKERAKPDTSDDDAEPSRGGLESWREEEPEPGAEPRSAYEVLAEYGFGIDEMRRLLRSKDANELDGSRDVFAGLLRARTLALGPQGVLTELLDDVGGGRAGKLETNMLLTLLDRQPELQSERTAAVLGDLARSVRPVDIGPLRALARVQARQGNTAEARRLYRWLATRTEGSSYFYDAGPTITQEELVEDVKENLAGEDRLAVIDMVIQFADRGDYPWYREQFERLVLDTYMELLEPADALARCREVVDGATDFSEGMRRNVALTSAVLLAENGEVDAALRCLEYGICSLDPSVVEGDARYWNDPTRPGWWSDRDLRRLFPTDGAKFARYDEWLRAAAEALRTWIAADRVQAYQARKALVVLCLRLHAAGDTSLALDLLNGMADDRGEQADGLRLWVVDALRVCGDEALADSMERELLVDGRLHLERLHEVVRRELERYGPEAALALGAPVTEFVLNARLLDVLVEAAETLGDAQELARWTDLRTRAVAARERLAEIAEAERLAAEAQKQQGEPQG
ncbi:MAG: hypothetical protein H6828_02330 [Planctomycetes bacterium]|nr:hypothetical protein [Planctomycetota bacterium]